MYDKARTRRKIIAISCIAVVMAGLLYVYDLNAESVERGMHAFTSALSPARALKERAIKAEFGALGSVRPSDDTGPWKGAPAFVYHGIVDRADRFNITEDAFKDQMFALKRAGYETVTLREYQEFVRGEKELPPKSFLLTFDDGRIDSYENADPILKALGYEAVMFVASGASMTSKDVRWSYYISKNDIYDMLGDGRWEIASHAVQADGGYVTIDAEGRKANFLSSRRWLPERDRLETEQEYAERIAYEFDESQAVMEEAFRIPVESFSYPFGDYGQQTKNHDGAEEAIGAAIRERYAFAFRQVWPNDGEFAFNRAGDDPYRLKRIETPTDWTGDQLVDFMEISRDKTLPYNEEFRQDAGWQSTWGEIVRKEEGLHVIATEATSGGAAFLDGTRGWEDYSYSVLFDRLKGSHVTLLARYHDPRNHLDCTFGEGHVKIERVVDGVPELIADATGTPIASVRAVAGMRVRGATVECLVGTQVVASATGTEGSGGIGVRVWDRALDNADLLLRNVVITPL